MVVSIKMKKGKEGVYKPRTRERGSTIKSTPLMNMGATQQMMTTMKTTEAVYGSSGKTLGYGGKTLGYGNASGYGNTSAQVETFKETRVKEKFQMQDLNSRLAHYIEISRYNEALNKKLKEAIDKLKNSPNNDADDIKKMYEVEMEQLRKLLDDCENEKNKEKSAYDNSQDVYNELDEMLNECQGTEEDNRDRIKQQYDNLADYEAKIARIQREIDMANEDRNRNKCTLENLRMNLNQIKNEITNETFSRIEGQNQYKLLKDELELQMELNDKELGEVRFVPYEDKINESRNWWSNEFSNCIKDIQEEYETRLASIKNELQSNYACKVHEVQVSAARTNTESATMQDKYSILKESSLKLKSNLNNTKQENLLYSHQNEALENELNELQEQYDQLLFEKDNEMNDIREQLEKTLSELQDLMENNMTLKLEIDSYMTLLENEEIRVGIKNEDGDYMYSHNSMSFESQNLAPMLIKGEVNKSTTFQKSSKGPVIVCEVSDDGSFIALENTNHSRTEVLHGCKIIQNVDNVNTSQYDIEDYVLKPKEVIKIWANGMGNPEKNDQIWVNKVRLGVGNKVITTLMDSQGEEKATYTLQTKYSV